MAPKPRSPIERALPKIQITPGCWIWTGTKHSGGYGTINVRLGVNAVSKLLVHRVVYEHYNGPIPRGLTLDHLCRNRLCVNPDHLEPVTNKENILRGEAFSAVFARRDRCVRGHLLTPENTSRYSHKGIDQGRICRTCHRERQREQNRKHRDKRNALRRNGYAKARALGYSVAESRQLSRRLR